MKYFITLFIGIGWFNCILSQQLYVDTMTAPAMLIQAGALEKGQERTNEELNKIQKAQLLVQTQLEKANRIQDKLFQGLTYVSQTVRSGYYVKEIISASDRMLQYSGEALEMIKEHPEFSVFIIKSTNKMKERALILGTNMNRLLKDDESNLMNAGDRLSLLSEILRELKILVAHAYTIKHTLYWAIQDGFLHSLNPFKTWINNDVRIMQDIIRQSKGL